VLGSSSSEGPQGSNFSLTPFCRTTFSSGDRKNSESVSKASSSSYQYSLEDGIVSPRFHSRGSTTFSSDDRKNSESVSQASSSSYQYSLENGIVSPGFHSRGSTTFSSDDRKNSESVSKEKSSSDQDSLENGIVSPGFHSRGRLSSSQWSSLEKRVKRDVIVPAGQLGLLIDSSSDGPIVSSLISGSVLSESVFDGDLIVAVDDEDTSGLSARHLKKLLARKSGSVRKLTLLSYNKYSLLGFEEGNASPKCNSKQKKWVKRDVVAPTGKLGIVIDSSRDGPIVCSLKDDSPLLELVFIGDLIVAVDDEDTSGLSARHLTKLLARKSGSVKKLTLQR
jgi:hypothetical protein